MKVAIQGVKASFHDVASRKFFKDQKFEAVECSSFPILFETLEKGGCDYAVMAIENALAGSILHNYGLLEKHHFKIIGETYLRIQMCLLALPGEKLNDIKVVQSHPMALLQCKEFLDGLQSVKLVEHADTAESAYEIKTKNLTYHAAIASALAAETYGLEILQSNIETHHANYTRFLVLCRESDYRVNPRANKCSLCFETEHRPGSLARVLNVFDKYEINMSKIHSLHIVGKPFHYAFHVDLEWSDKEKYQLAMRELKNKVMHMMHFGDYEAGEKPAI